MAYFKITLIRSGIGLYNKQKVLTSLGLKKRYKPVFHPVSQDIAGKIMQVKELVQVKEVDAPEPRGLKKSDPGFYVERPARVPATTRLSKENS